jgi:hypothetical protein
LPDAAALAQIAAFLDRNIGAPAALGGATAAR